MDEQERVTRQGDGGEQVEKRSATEVIIGLGAPAILGASHITGKLIDRLPKKEAPQSEKGE